MITTQQQIDNDNQEENPKINLNEEFLSLSEEDNKLINYLRVKKYINN